MKEENKVKVISMTLQEILLSDDVVKSINENIN